MNKRCSSVSDKIYYASIIIRQQKAMAKFHDVYGASINFVIDHKSGDEILGQFPLPDLRDSVAVTDANKAGAVQRD